MTLEPETRVQIPLYAKTIVSETSPDVSFPVWSSSSIPLVPCKLLPQG